MNSPPLPKPPIPKIEAQPLFGIEGDYAYKRGGDYYLCELAPKLARDLAKFLENGNKKDLREIGMWMFKWNKKNII